jgi:hypothetical protein
MSNWRAGWVRSPKGASMIKAIQKSISKILNHHVTEEQTKVILAVISIIDHQNEIKIPNEGIISNGITPGAPFYDIVQNIHGVIQSVDVSMSHDMSYPVEHIITIHLCSNEMIII